MKEANTREAVLSVVYQVFEEKKHSDTVLHQVLSEFDEKIPDRSRIKREAYGVIEHQIELDYVINRFSELPVRKMKPWLRTILRMAVYEIRYMDNISPATSCDEAVKLTGKKGYRELKGFVNGVLRSICREGENVRLPDLSVTYSMPEWIVNLLSDSYGIKTTKKILASFFEERPVTIRVNTNKVSIDEMKKLLQNENIAFSAGVYLGNALRLEGNIRVERLPGYREGYFVVQDESSMLPVLVSGIKSGFNVMDLCAAPGGKTMQAAELLQGNGVVSSRDLTEYKVKKITENKERTGYQTIREKVWDATIMDMEWKEKADVVIADVPCSGLGIIGRKPDIKYQISESSLDGLVKLQREILTQAVAYVKHGGVLIYSTCTLNPAENTEQARWLSKKGLELESLDEWLPEKLRNSQTRQGMLQILPGVQKSDGFFVAKFRKV